jgi:hypothetical protein
MALLLRVANFTLAPGAPLCAADLGSVERSLDFEDVHTGSKGHAEGFKNPTAFVRGNCGCRSDERGIVRSSR